MMVWCAPSVPDGYRVIAGEYDIPYTVLYAVALAESGVGKNGRGIRRPWPWTLNVAGRGRTYPSRDAAWTALNFFLAKGERSIDIGLMQVNWRYHQNRLRNTWRALDPYFNLRVGAAILRQCYEQRADWWKSVGCYHAPSNPERARRYRARVLNHWQRLSTSG
jgi:soluble lytic murein transglycosylase-like protein